MLELSSHQLYHRRKATLTVHISRYDNFRGKRRAVFFLLYHFKCIYPTPWGSFSRLASALMVSHCHFQTVSGKHNGTAMVWTSQGPLFRPEAAATHSETHGFLDIWTKFCFFKEGEKEGRCWLYNQQLSAGHGLGMALPVFYQLQYSCFCVDCMGSFWFIQKSWVYSILPTSFYETSITLITKPNNKKKITRRL